MPRAQGVVVKGVGVGLVGARGASGRSSFHGCERGPARCASARGGVESHLQHFVGASIVEASKKVGWRERLRARRANDRAKAADRAMRGGADRAPTERQDDVKFGQLGGYAGDRRQGGRL